MADFLHLENDVNDLANEPVNEGHAGGVERAAERDSLGVGAPPNAFHGLDDDDSKEEVRDPEDAASEGTLPRREPLECFTPSSRGGGFREQDAVGQAVEELAGFSDRNRTEAAKSSTLLVVDHCARTQPRGWLRWASQCCSR